MIRGLDYLTDVQISTQSTLLDSAEGMAHERLIILELMSGPIVNELHELNETCWTDKTGGRHSCRNQHIRDYEGKTYDENFT